MRRLRSSAAAALTLLVTAAVASAQTEDAIIAKIIEAKGGLEILKGTTSVRMVGTATMQGTAVPVVTISKRPNLMRNEMDVAGQKMVQGYDGTTMWVLLPGMPAQELPAGPQTDLLKGQSEFDSVFLDWKEKGHKIDYKGKEGDAGKEQHHLIVKRKEGPVVHYYVDAATGLETRMVMEIEDPSAKGHLETRMSDYRNIDGRMIPFVIARFLNGNPVGDLKLEKVEFNVPLDDTLFKMPK